MGALSAVELEEALAADADVVVWNERQVAAVAAAGGGRVHVKLDSGMGRLGTRDPAEASRAVAAARYAAGVELAGVMTHFATADDPDDDGFFERQLEVVYGLGAGDEGRAAGDRRARREQRRVLREQGAHFDMVRCGIAAYGMDPFGEDPGRRGDWSRRSS